MILYSALVFAAVFASGTFLLLQRDLTRVIVGIILVSNAAVLFIVSAGLTHGAAPIHPLEGAGPVSDPLVQAMALTALVIGFGVAALLLAMVYRLYSTHRTVDAEEIADCEMRQAEAVEHADDPEGEEVAFAVGAFSIAGVPPAAGFVGKMAVFKAAISEESLPASLSLVALIFVGGALSFLYSFQVYQRRFMKPGSEGKPSPRAARWLVVALAGIVVLLGLWPEPLIYLSEAAAGALVGGAR